MAMKKITKKKSSSSKSSSSSKKSSSSSSKSTASTLASIKKQAESIQKSLNASIKSGEIKSSSSSSSSSSKSSGSSSSSNVDALAKQLAQVSAQAKSLGIDTQTADKMVAQTKAQGSTAFKGSSYDTPNTPVPPVIPPVEPVVPPVEPTQPEAPVEEPTDPTQTDPTQTDPNAPQTPEGVITDPVTGNQYQQDASGAYVPYTGAQATGGSTSPAPTSTYSGASIVDFLNSSGQASDFGSRSSLAQKYGITNYTGTASQNTQLLNTLRGASTTSPAQTYAPATVGSSDLAPAPVTGEPTALDMAMSQFGVGFDPASFAMSPQISIQTLIKDLMTATNLPDITSNIDNISSEIEDLANERDDEIRAVNDDPWLTEGVRIQRVNKVNAKYEDRIKNKTAYLTLMQGAYDDARQQAQWVAQTALEQYDTQRRFQFDQLKYWTDQAEAQLKAQQEALKQDYSGIKSVQNGLYDVASGTWLVPPKADSGGSGSSNQTIDNERALFNQFNGEPIVKDFNTILAKKMSVERILQAKLGGPGDLATVYEFMKALDPTSVVRETEYASAAKSGNIFAGAYARYNGYLKEQGGFLPDSVKSGFMSIIDSKLDVQRQLFNNTKSQYEAIAVRQGLNPQNVTIDYGAGPTNDYDQYRSQLQPGEQLVLRNGVPTAIYLVEFNSKTDKAI